MPIRRGRDREDMGGVVLAAAFAAIWIYAVYREDVRNPEPVWLVALATLGGALAVPVAAWIELRVVPDLSVLEGPLAGRAAVALLVAGPVEEALKFLAVGLVVWRQHHFDEPLDGLVYAAAAAGGFALVENLHFLQDDPASILARAPGATGAHIVFAALWGGALGHARQLDRPVLRAGIVAAGLALSFLAHGLFDLTTWSVGRELTLAQGRVIGGSLVAVCAVFMIARIRSLQRPARPLFGGASR